MGPRAFRFESECPRGPESGNLPGSHSPAALREKASAAVGSPASRPARSTRGGAFDWGASDAVIAFLFLLVGAAPPVADTSATVVPVPGIVVEGERPIANARARMPTAFVTELPARRPGRAIESISDVLAEAAGVRVVQYGGLGAFSTVSLRGASPGQVSVFLDGAPLTSAAHGVVSLADLPATAIERVEVYRGLAPLGLGVATPGGAVNLITASAPELREARLARGSFGTWEGRASAGAVRGALSGTVHAGYQGSNGDFRFFDDNGTPFNAADDDTSTRVNNRFDAATLLATVAWRPSPAVRVRVREDLFHKAQGLPGLGAAPAIHPRLAFDRSLSQLDATLDAGGWRPALEWRGSLQRARSRFRDSDAQLGLGTHATDDRFAGEEGALSARWARLRAGFSLEVTGAWRGERARIRDAADGAADPPASRRRGHGAAASLQWRPLAERIVVHVARRWDRIEDALRWNGTAGIAQASDVAREVAVPQAGAGVALPFGLGARANWTRAERVPDFLELFGNQGSVMGNATLRPERAENWDAGASWSMRRGALRAEAEWAHFESRAEDLIVYERSSPSSVRARNVSRASVRGEELSLRASGALGLAATAAFTWQSALDEGPVSFWHGKRLPQRPGRQASVRLDGHWGRVHAGADVQYIGDNVLDPYNRYRVASRTLVGASLGWSAPGERFRLVLEGRNLGDRQVSDVAGFPLPGRALFAALDVRIAPADHAR
jgi:iron complex outermembrane receptor protein